METSRAVHILGALAEETRLSVLRTLLAAGPSGMPAGEVANRLGLPASTTSFHLSALERAGLTQSTRQGRRIIHAVRIAMLRGLIAFLTEACCAGRPEICGDIARLLPEMVEEDLHMNTHMTAAFNVLFLCTRNSARSLMAEAILNKLGGDRFRAYSAGSDPAPQPMPEVIQKLQALGHDVSSLHTKSWTTFMHQNAPRMDFVIALCDVLQGQVCPDFGESVVTGSWPLPDPAKFEGSEAERALLVNELYASLNRRISIFANLPFAKLDRIALRARVDEIADAPLAAVARH
jgi:ArsR family transcriptional regulator, arsenate/arsenite/antimonite-responsive transcriptional repressor / arsenate reductase (thioredoxin)